jgi:hypothetical protein
MHPLSWISPRLATRREFNVPPPQRISQPVEHAERVRAEIRMAATHDLAHPSLTDDLAGASAVDFGVVRRPFCSLMSFAVTAG